MATTQAGLDAAYSTEINNCTFNADLGVRFRSRPQSFCDSVTISKTLDVADVATFAVPIKVAQAVVVDDISYSPSTFVGFPGGVEVGVLTSNGDKLIVPAPTPYALPPATATTLGGIIVGSGLSVTTDGTLSASGGGGGGGATVSPSPPLNPVEGDLWWSDTNGDMFVYYDDGDSQQWVSVVSGQQFTASLLQCDILNVVDSATFNNITITGTATGALDAGAY